MHFFVCTVTVTYITSHVCNSFDSLDVFCLKTGTQLLFLKVFIERKEVMTTDTFLNSIISHLTEAITPLVGVNYNLNEGVRLHAYFCLTLLCEMNVRVVFFSFIHFKSSHQRLKNDTLRF